MQQAPIGSVYVVSRPERQYAADLAHALGRGDLVIRTQAQCGIGSLRGTMAPAVIVDHSCQLTELQAIEVHAAQVTIARRLAAAESR